MTKQLNTDLYDYPELDKFLDDITKHDDEDWCSRPDVEQKLLELQTTIEQLQQENKELKSKLGVSIAKEHESYCLLKNLANFVTPPQETAEQSLQRLSKIIKRDMVNASEKLKEHDKQTAIKAIEDMIENTEPYITNKGYQIREVDDILDYISQLKDS